MPAGTYARGGFPVALYDELTYMLTTDEISRAKADGRLFPALPIAKWQGTPRALLMCTALWNAIEEGRREQKDEQRAVWARLEAAFSHFIEGGLVTNDFLKQLKPEKYEHWEIRSRKPRPSMRVFGRFAMPDVFIATHVVRRSELGGMWSMPFEHHKLVCEDHWKAAQLSAPFSDAPSFRYEKYITENAAETLRGLK